MESNKIKPINDSKFGNILIVIGVPLFVLGVILQNYNHKLSGALCCLFGIIIVTMGLMLKGVFD